MAISFDTGGGRFRAAVTGGPAAALRRREGDTQMKRKMFFSSLLACGALPCLAQNPASVHQVGAPVRQTIAPARTEAVTVDSLPNAVCTLSVQDDSGAAKSLKLYADDQGQVRFHAQTAADTDNPARLDLQCETSDQVMQ